MDGVLAADVEGRLDYAVHVVGWRVRLDAFVSAAPKSRGDEFGRLAKGASSSSTLEHGVVYDLPPSFDGPRPLAA